MQHPSIGQPLPVAILAGGLGTRLKPITEKIPKALVSVAGRPFLAHQLDLLRANGIERAVLCVGYLGEMIRDEFGDGRKFGVELEYSFDGAKLLGTGGALRKALPLLGPAFYVLYGDSYLPVDYRRVADAFFKSEKPALMTVFGNQGKWDTSNVWFTGGEIKIYDKNNRRPEMQHIDYGLSILSGTVLDEVPSDEPSDLADLLCSLSAAHRLSGFEVFERFYEVGSPQGLLELEALLTIRLKK